jgi:hypothetical protein
METKRFTEEEQRFITPGVSVQEAELLANYPLGALLFDIDWTENEFGDYVNPLAQEWERQLNINSKKWLNEQ